MNTVNSKKTIFYATIVILSLLIANYSNIKLNTFFAIILAAISIYYFNKNIKFKDEIEKEITEEKKNYIVPNTKLEDKTLIDFIFSVQDFHRYNPIAYENFVDCLENFFKVVDNIKKNNKTVYSNWSILENYKKCSLNNLHSITLSIPSDTNLIAKLDKKTLDLEEIFDSELLKIYDIYKDTIRKNRDWHSKEITIGPKPYNIGESNIHSFEFYM